MVLQSLLVPIVLTHALQRASTTFGMPSIFSDDMVLPAAPRDAQIWGWSTPGDIITATLTSRSAIANRSTSAAASTGRWTITFNALEATTDVANLTIAYADDSRASVVYTGVTVGRIILCGGQSNMQFSVRQSFNGSKEVAAAGDWSRQIRVLTVKRVALSAGGEGPGLPQLSGTSAWNVASPRAVDDGKSFGLFSAECWLVGRELAALHPNEAIGLVSSCWSGSMIQPWIPSNAMSEACPKVRARGNETPFLDGQYFNAMIAPLAGLQFHGVIFHQGEENAGDPLEYGCLFPALINAWRLNFALVKIPFVFVQLQPCGIPLAMRLAQEEALTLTAVAMATAVDFGDAGATVYDNVSYPINPDGMCHTRYKPDIAKRIVPLLDALMSVEAHSEEVHVAPAASLPLPKPPTVDITSLRSVTKDYRTVIISLNVTGDGADAISFHGTPQCRWCCNDVLNDASPLQVRRGGDPTDWVGVPLRSKHGNWAVSKGGVLSGPIVVEPPFKAMALRYAANDFNECMLFTNDMYPVPPFEVVLPSVAVATPSPPASCPTNTTFLNQTMVASGNSRILSPPFNTTKSAAECCTLCAAFPACSAWEYKLSGFHWHDTQCKFFLSFRKLSKDEHSTTGIVSV